MPFAFGPPFVDWPAAEMQGEILLQAQKYEEAAGAFETQLKRARQRARSLRGLVRSQQKMGNEAEANYSLEKLRVLWHDADEAVRAQLDRLADAAP